MINETYDAIIVGGGHNGLTAAGYLGKAGYKTVQWDASAYSSGMYFYRLSFDGFSGIRKMVLIK